MEYRIEFGVSPIDDLIDARVNRAEYMLTHLTSTIKQIAKECGFNSEEHFSRVFYSRRGCSPGKFRKR
jgi:AraC-like DNA-binding protein